MALIELRTRWSIVAATGYNKVTLYADGQRMSACDGGGYDMVGTVWGEYIATVFYRELWNRIRTKHYGLSFADPGFDAGKVRIRGKTIATLEREGLSFGLDRYQAHLAAQSELPTEQHVVAQMDGGCGYDCMTRVFKAIGGDVSSRKRCGKDDERWTISTPPPLEQHEIVKFARAAHGDFRKDARAEYIINLALRTGLIRDLNREVARA